MFKIVLLITTFGITGHTLRVPLDSHPEMFSTYEACIEVIKSDNFDDEIVALGKRIAADGHSSLIESQCVLVPDARVDPNGNLLETIDRG